MAQSSIAITVRREDPASTDGRVLLDELSAMLALFSGDGGQSRFDVDEFRSGNGMFYVARTAVGEALGCGAFRHFDASAAELKRIYSRQCRSGVGTAIIQQLEADAAACGYTRLVLETRVVNKRAIDFYQRNGYRPTERYGAYIGQPDARCFEKMFVDN